MVRWLDIPPPTRRGIVRRGIVGWSTLCVLAGALLTGCGYGDICEAWMGCRGGNDADVVACEAYMDSRDDRSSNDGCEEDWDALVTCMEEHQECQDEAMAAETACTAEEERWNACVGWSFFGAWAS